MVIGLTSGCWDLFHYSHLHYLERCRNQCDKLLVGVDSDALVKQAKGDKRPIIPEDERYQLIVSLEIVDAAFMLHTLEDLEIISKSFLVNKVFKHQGFKEIDNVIGVNNPHAKLVIVPDIKNMVNTTLIIERIVARYRSS